MPKLQSAETMEKSKKSEKEAAAAANETKAIHLKTLAEQFYHSSDLKSALKHAKKSLRLCPHLDGTAELLTAFKILRSAAAKSTVDGSLDDWYKILQIEPFSHINTIKKQYKKLALALHPDKNPFDASEEAFKLVGEAFRVLSDKIRRKEYDMKLRIAMQDVAAAEIDVEVVETFWTACSTCRLLHQFERKYLGHNLMCPSCKKSFKAVEFCDDDGGGGVGERIRTKKSSRSSSPPRVRVRNCEVKRKMSSVGELLKREESKRIGRSEIGEEIAVSGDASGNLGISGGGSVNEGLRSKRVRKPRDLDKNDGGSSIAIVVSERLKAKRAKIGDDEMMTLAEIQMLAKKKASEKISKLKENEKEKVKERKETCESTKCGDLVTEKRSSSKNGTLSGASKSGHMEIMTVEDLDFYDVDKDRPERCSRKGEKGKERKETSELTNGGNLESEKKSSSKNGTSSRASKSGHMEIMTVEDSDFYDFDKDRAERSFRKGQVWAIFDDDDGMPRQYALIDDVVSVNPFQVTLSWLDLQNDVEVLISWEKLGFRICCGRFKVSRKISVNMLNIFSHVVDCDRMAKELYRIYPKKGSVWALYNENAKDSEGRNLVAKDRRSYDIAVFLTSYSEVHGLSMGYLEKVDGFKSVFKRKDIGGHAIKWLEKDDIRLFSHQIPARKLSGEEASVRVKDCWELDPASLPPELLAINWDR